MWVMKKDNEIILQMLTGRSVSRIKRKHENACLKI